MLGFQPLCIFFCWKKNPPLTVNCILLLYCDFKLADFACCVVRLITFFSDFLKSGTCCLLQVGCLLLLDFVQVLVLSVLSLFHDRCWLVDFVIG